MKAIITDLDRTLLHTDKTISSYSIEILSRCRKAGIRIMAATARPFRSIQEYLEQIPFDAVTTLNGAVVVLPDNIYTSGIAKESGEKTIAGLLAFPDVLISMETSNGFYANREIAEWQPIVYEHFPKLPENIDIYKILASSDRKELYQQAADVLTDDVYYTIATNELVQIMGVDATKWNGIKKMLSYFGIAPEAAVYFGDDYDDIEPIAKCGIGVAVSNAIPEVLKAADCVTESNDLDGVANYIERYVLEC